MSKLAAQRATELKDSKSEAVEIVNTAKQNGEKQREGMVTRSRRSPTLKQNAKRHRTISFRCVKQCEMMLLNYLLKLLLNSLRKNCQSLIKSLINSYIEGLDKQNETR